MLPSRIWIFLLIHLCSVYSSKPKNVRIGVISEPTDDLKQNDPKFWSFCNDYRTTVTVTPIVTTVQWWDSLQVTRSVCRLFSQGVDGLLSFLPPNLSPVLSSYAETYGLPLITKSSLTNSKVTGALHAQVEMIPNTERAVSDILGFYKWKSFAFIYDSDDGPMLLQRLLERNLQADVEAVWRVSNGEQAVRLLQILESNSQYQTPKDVQNVLFVTDNSLLDETLMSLPLTVAEKLRFHFVSAHPVLRLQERYFPVWHLVTRLCLVDSNSTVYKSLESRWLTIPQPYSRISETSKNELPESAILTRDAVALLSKSYHSFVPYDDIFGKHDDDDSPVVQTTCSQNPEKKHVTPSTKGVKASEHLQQTVLENGVTGKVKFDGSSERTDFGLHIFETVASVTKKVGEWSDYDGLKMFHDKISTKEPNDDPHVQNDKDRQVAKPIIVTSVLVKPYLMLKSSSTLQGNDRFEGFIKDLLDEVSDIINTPYELNLVKDGYYGMYNGTAWNGMIGEVVRGEADAVAAPLTVTRFRENAVDFTKPFISLGLNILMKKPAVLDGSTSARLTPFGFLSAFTYDTWLVLLAAYLLFGAGFFAVSRFTGAPDRIRSVDTKGSDQLSVCSSYWFATGSLFLQNTGIYPRSVSHRVLSGVWWILTLITVVAYIGSLSSMLIKERTKIHGSVDTYLTSFQLLKNLMETGSPVIGVVGSGSTRAFFKHSEVGLYHDYGKYLEQNPGVITSSYSEGTERVRKSNGSYAFIMESTSAEYITNHYPCDTVSTPGYLDGRTYALAVRKGSALKDSLDHALLNLLESGALRQIYEKWWHSDTECSNPSLDVLPGLYDNSLTASEVSGAFYVLMIGVIAASTAAVIEYLVRSKKLPVDK